MRLTSCCAGVPLRPQTQQRAVCLRDPRSAAEGVCCVCVYVCMYVWVCVVVQAAHTSRTDTIHEHMNTRTHEHTNTRTHEHTNARTHERTNTRTHEHTNTHSTTRTRECTNTKPHNTHSHNIRTLSSLFFLFLTPPLSSSLGLHMSLVRVCRTLRGGVHRIQAVPDLADHETGVCVRVCVRACVCVRVRVRACARKCDVCLCFRYPV